MLRQARTAAALVPIVALLGAACGATAAAADPGNSSPQYFYSLGSYATFVADDGVNGPSLFVSHGTVASTRRLTYACTEPCFPQPFASVGDAYFFTAVDGDSGALWVTRGTSATTRKLLSSFNWALFGGNIGSQGFDAQGLAYFVAAAGSNDAPYALWRSDGTRAGTFALGTFTNLGWGPTELFLVGGEVYFGGDDGAVP